MITLIVTMIIKLGIWMGIWMSPFPMSWTATPWSFILVLLDLALTAAIVGTAINILRTKKGWW